MRPALKHDRLMVIAFIMLAVGIAISCFTLWYSIVNQDSLSQSIESNIKSELSKYNIPNKEALTIDEAKLAIAIAKYCETRNHCVGSDGVSIAGPIGAPGKDGLPGAQGIAGYTPLKGVDYFDGVDGIRGEQGPPGETAPRMERQCNPDERRMEWRYVGDENWQVEFYLAGGQKCEAGGNQ